MSRFDVKKALSMAQEFYQEFKSRSELAVVTSKGEAKVLKWVVQTLLIDQRNAKNFIDVLPFVDRTLKFWESIE